MEAEGVVVDYLPFPKMRNPKTSGIGAIGLRPIAERGL